MPAPRMPAAPTIRTPPARLLLFTPTESATGMIVYQSNTFGGHLKGRILMCRYSGGSDIEILTPSADGKTLTGINGKGLSALFNPIDVVEDTKNGNLYVSTNSPNGGLNIIL